MRTEAEWAAWRIQAKQEFSQQMEVLIPGLDGLLRELRSMPRALPPPSGYTAPTFEDAVRAVYNEVPNEPPWTRERSPEFYARYNVKPDLEDYRAVHGYNHIPYRYLWSTSREKQHWVQFEVSRFLSWAVVFLTTYPDFKYGWLARDIPQTLIDNLSGSQKQELRRQILRLAQVEPINRWLQEHIDTRQIVADIQRITTEVVYKMQRMRDSL